MVCLFVCFVALRPKSTAMVMAGRSVHLTTLFPGHDHEIISTVILLPSAESFKKGFVSYKRKYVHEVLVNCLFKLAQEKVWLGELAVPP